jgi:hypothetical protein
MRIVHRIAINASPEERSDLCKLGFTVGEGWAVFEVDESDIRWPALQEWLQKNRIGYLTNTKFTPEEMARASWLKIVSSGPRGYPQPEDDFGYLGVTYDVSEYCKECGVGAIQKAPFRMRGDPKWGRNLIVQLNWVTDEYFVKTNTWKEIFEPLGIACRPVHDIKGNEIKTVVQLVALKDEVDLIMDGHPSQTCPTCGRVKYLGITRGQYPPPRTEPKGHYLKTRQWFGGGASAGKPILVSQTLRRALSAHKAPGVWFIPAAEPYKQM